MKYSYHVVTPFRRFENLEPLVNMLRGTPVTWHPIFDEGLPFDIHFPYPWIEKGYVPRSQPFWSLWADSLNRFIAAGRLNPRDRYMILNDDDGFEPEFFKKLDTHDGDILVVSMKRGHHTPAGVAPERAHGTETLIAAPENMQVGGVGAEQMICTGEIFERYIFNNSISADGERIIKVVTENPTVYVPDVFVHFNFLEPGRWDK